jgi:hypothetical protein
LTYYTCPSDSSGHFTRRFRREPVAPMKNSPSKAVAPSKPVPWTLQRFFDKWFLPVVFVGIGSLIVWAIWRH